MRRLSSGPGALQDDQWIQHAETDLLNTVVQEKEIKKDNHKLVSRKQFHEWATIHLDVSVLLDTFRVFPTKEGQVSVHSQKMSNINVQVQNNNIFLIIYKCFFLLFLVSYSGENIKRLERIAIG